MTADEALARLLNRAADPPVDERVAYAEVLRAELERLRAVEARVNECANEHRSVGPITAHYILTGAPFGVAP